MSEVASRRTIPGTEGSVRSNPTKFVPTLPSSFIVDNFQKLMRYFSLASVFPCDEGSVFHHTTRKAEYVCDGEHGSSHGPRAHVLGSLVCREPIQVFRRRSPRSGVVSGPFQVWAENPRACEPSRGS